MNITGKLLTIIVSTLVLSVFAAACGSDTPAVEEPTEETKVSQMEENVPEESTQPDPTPEPPTPEPTEAPPEDTANGTGRIGNELLAPELTQVFSWINSEPLTLEGLRGDVVLIDFWTYTCINCIRTLPYLKDWHDKYADLGLTIIGVHTPEFDFEKKKENVIDAVAEYGLKYPVVQDNDFGTWRAFENRYWPAKYLIDKDGYIRYTHFGEGAYQETEEKIRELLMETSSGVEEISLDVKPAPEVHTAAYSASGSRPAPRGSCTRATSATTAACSSARLPLTCCPTSTRSTTPSPTASRSTWTPESTITTSYISRACGATGGRA